MSESEKTNDPHDTRLSELFNNKEAFISFLQDCVKPPWIADLDEETLRRSPKDYILQDFKKKKADVVYEGTLKNGKEKVIFFVLQENQSRVDYRMGYRLLLYIVEILRDYYNHADENERKRKDFKFPAVVPIVFYTGSRRWVVPRSLKEMFAGHRRFGDYLLNFQYALVDAKGYDDNSVKDFRSKLLKVMMLFEKAKNHVEVAEKAVQYKEEIQNFNDEEKRVINVAFDILKQVHGSMQDFDFNKILYSGNAEGVDRMLADVIANAKNYDRNLIKQVRKEEKIELAKKMLLNGESIEKIISYTELTEKKIREIEKTL